MPLRGDKITKMIRKLVAIIIGMLVLNLVGISGIVSQTILPFIANFTGGFSAGLIVRKHGLAYGTIVSVGSFLFLIFSLIFISYKASGGAIFLPNIALLYPNLFAVILGPLGGYFAENMLRKGKGKQKIRN